MTSDINKYKRLILKQNNFFKSIKQVKQLAE